MHAGEELAHALTIAKQIDYLGGMPNGTALPVKLTDDAKGMLRADLQNENNTIRAYRERVQQCDALGEFAMAEEIREILRQEQEHQMDLATALGEDTPDVGGPRSVPEAVQGMEGGAGPDVDRIRPECGSNAHMDLIDARPFGS